MWEKDYKQLVPTSKINNYQLWKPIIIKLINIIVICYNTKWSNNFGLWLSKIPILQQLWHMIR